MQNAIGYYLRHKPSGDFSTSPSFKSNREFSQRAPHLFNGVGPVKAAVTYYIKMGQFFHQEEFDKIQTWDEGYRVANYISIYSRTNPYPAIINDKADRLKFAMELEIVEVELVPKAACYDFLFDLARVVKAGTK